MARTMVRTRNDNKIINIAVNDLRIHPVAQRRITAVHLGRFINNLDLDAIGVVHVVYYAIDGVLAYWVVDGQHRVEAIKFHGFGEWKVKAEIHHKIQDEAAASALFLKLNDRAVVATYDKFANQVSAGDEVAVGAVGVCAAAGLKVTRTPHDGSIACVKAISDLWRVDRGQTLGETLGVLVGAAGPTKDAVDGTLVTGVGKFLTTFNGTVDRRLLTAKLAKYPGGPGALLGNARGLKKLRGHRSLAVCLTEILVDVYNTGRRNGRITLER